MKLEGKVRIQPSPLANGAEEIVGLNDRGGLSVGNVSAKYYDLVRQGNVFRGQTDTSGVAPGTAIGTTSALALYNPAGSGVNLVVLDFSLGYHSGTLGAGYIAICANTNVNAAAVTGTSITPVNALLGSANSAVGQLFDAATVPATPDVIGAFCSTTALLASTAVGVYQTHLDVGGAIVVGPGATVSLQGDTAAGSSPLVVLGATWQEVPA